MNFAICDDNLSFRKEIEKLIIESCIFPSYHFEHFDSAEQLITSMENKKQYDIILLDVEMDGMNGIQAGKIINDKCKNTIIIYTSSYSKYAIDSFDNAPLHYILKPLDIDKFFDVLAKAKRKIEELYSKIDIVQKDGVFSIFIQDIIYVEYYKKHLIYHCNDENIEIVGKVKDVYNELEKYGFILINQGTLVNANYIKQILKSDIITTKNDRLPISVRKKTEVVNRFVNFVKGKRK